ncbi:MAG: ribosome small subunit-dependent GTPase A [Planctomycetaceae bacterium]
MADDRNRKIRVRFHKNRGHRTRQVDLTRQSHDELADLPSDERVSGKGAQSRHRTVVVKAGNSDAESIRDVDMTDCQRGRVLWSVGANHSCIQTSDGRTFDCSVRRVLRTMERETRNVVAAGDWVVFRSTDGATGVIERIEPRHSTLARGVGRTSQIIVSNVDQAAIVASACDPPLKPALIDRFLVSCEIGRVKGIVCINKADSIEPAHLQPIIGQYAQLGCEVVLTSATRGDGIDRLRHLMNGKATVLTGQSGVGKSSLLNAVQPGLGLRTATVSADSGKGRHTTRVAELVPLTSGGWVVDTPGIRQFQLWAVDSADVEAYFIEFRPFVAHCKFADCTHTHERGCAVLSAVSQGLISALRYESYTRILSGEAERIEDE